ncbi:MAG: RNA polymerase sigma factor [Myxococcota bacterium]
MSIFMGLLATFRRRGGLNPTEPNDPDTALMLRVRDGDEDAFVQLYHAYRDRIVAFTTRMLGSPAMGEEAAQDVFLKLYKAAPRYEPSAKFSTYLYRIATRHCLNLKDRHSFKKTQSGLESDREADTTQGPADSLRKRELRDALRVALGKIPEKQRAALVLVHYEGQSYKDAAATLGVSDSALKSLIHRARGQLSQLLDPELSQPMEKEHAV